MRTSIFYAAALLCLPCVTARAQDVPRPESPAHLAARTQWWREARFGMFIHWGIYAVPASAAGGAEWYLSGSRVQVKDYEKLAAQFNPVRFSAAEWVRAAKNAGMKYIVITSKHHDGFCMFRTTLTPYNIVDATPFRRDPMAELAVECRRQGIRLCFYHSIMDWHHPDYLPRRPWEAETRPAAGADLNRYIDYMEGELRELLTNYGPIGVLWFDGGWEHSAAELRSAEVNRMIRSLQPGILINDRNQLPEDFSTPEQTIPASAMAGGRLWETCMTINDTWGYTKDNTNWKSAADLVHKLCDIASKGGNFLLNVGPTAEGVFPRPILERLGEIGDWMRVNGASIHGTTRSPFRRLAFEGRCTAKRNVLYLQVFRWPDEGLTLSGLQTPVLEARTMDGQRLRVTRAAGAETTYVSRPARLDPIATVVAVRLAGAPVVTQTALAQEPGADGAFVLGAADAEIHGTTAQYEQGAQRDNIGFWTVPGDYVTWVCRAPAAGRYRVEVTYACPPENAGSRYSVGVEQGGSVQGEVKATGDWGAFRAEPLGELDLPAGAQILAVRVREMPRGAVMNLRSVRLVPVR
ncbi:MAG: alpha-L-fucosidase [Chthonomonadales bacterium]|nr:alpha-L-fucosidase [Chthonomonadales bacterium]